MNDRIKELIKHTDIWCDQNVESESPMYNNQWEYKFAELIVQECIDYCSENLSKTVGGALKIHFGIKNE
jgi:hypothetical protein